MGRTSKPGAAASFAYRFFNRHGGCSEDRFTSLNVGRRLGDRAEHIAENRLRVKNAVGAPVLVSAHQVHGDRICEVPDGVDGDLEIPDCDALITDQPGVALMIQQADCQAVLLFDPESPAVAAIHCGWRGSVAGIIGKTVARLTQRLHTDPGRLQAFIGPSLGPCCAEFINFRTELPARFHHFQVRPAYFDFWEISRQQLLQAGVREAAIVTSRICTSCSPDYFSYRRACRNGDGTTGRHCSVISLAGAPGTTGRKG